MVAKQDRKEQILAALAAMLETHPGQRITTARLAADIGVSEAALYRHFASKAKMFEGLIEFTEATVLGNMNQVMEREKDTLTRCALMIKVLLLFVERNPGITRVLTGDALLGEHERLRSRVTALFDKVEAQLKQALREQRLKTSFHQQFDEALVANLMMAFAEGKIAQFVRSDFQRAPTQQFDQQWQLLAQQLLV